MKKIIIAALGIVVIAGIAYAVVKNIYDKSYSWRYKITVNIETPEGIKSGSTVRVGKNTYYELQPFGANKPLPTSAMTAIGAAVPIDLGERGVVFALITEHSYLEALDAFKLENTKDISKVPLGSRAELNDRSWLKMVTFTDLNNPRSVQLVYKHKEHFRDTRGKIDNFEQLFGSGVKLKSVIVEIVAWPVTWGEINKLLPWISEVEREDSIVSYNGGDHSKNAFLGLRGKHFIRKKYK